MFYYGMRLRGFSIGCQPMDGFVERLDSNDDRFYDIICYSRQLTDEETSHYSLTPLAEEEVKVTI